MHSNAKTGSLLAILAALVSGASIYVNKWAVAGLEPSVFTFSKNFLVAGALVAVLLLLKEKGDLPKVSKNQWALLVLIGLIGGAAPFLLFFTGLQMTSAASAAVIHKSMILLVAPLALFVLKERLRPIALLGALLLVAGNALVLRISGAQWGIGALLVAAATALWAMETIISSRVLRELPSRVVAAARMGFGAAFLFAYLALTKSTSAIIPSSLPQLQWILITSVLLLVYVSFWYEALRRLPAVVAVAWLSLGTVVTTVAQMLGGDQPLALIPLAGGMIILLGITAITATLTTVVPDGQKV